jgi:hypothetical protein
MIRGKRDLLLVHFVANGLLLWLAYEWLGVDESNTGKLLLSAFDALAILALACWLYGATMVHLQSPKQRLNDSFRHALRHISGLLAIAICGLALYGLLATAQAAVAAPSQRITTWLAWTFHVKVQAPAVASIFSWIVWLLRWVVLPVILLPIAASIALDGWSGWRHLITRRPLTQWIRIPLLTAAAFWLPLVLLQWKQHSPSFALEFTAFFARAAVAYLLFVASLIALAAIGAATGRERVPA